LEGATSTVPTGPYDTAGSEKLVVFAQKKIMLSWDLSINGMLRKSITDKITKGEGEVVESVEECDMFICQFREGDQYIRAAQQGKDVGNLAWLYHLMVYNEWTSPFRRLLHYPQPRVALPGFKDLRITLSNYGGEARIYLENLIKAAGATYTRTMKAENTHLITARMHSEKVDAARDWNIEIANHLWIEESYAACQALPLNNPRYRHFPPRTNLGEVIGQTFLDEPALREMYYPGGEETMDDAAKKKRAGKDGHGIWGGKRAADQLDKDRTERSSSPASKAADDDEEVDDVEEDKRPAKKAKLTLPEIDMRVCLTGYKRWVENKSTEEADRVSGCEIYSPMH
jgi:hypothetical protein